MSDRRPGRSSAGRARAAAAAASLLLLAACETFEGNRGVVPVVEVYREESGWRFPLTSIPPVRPRRDPGLPGWSPPAGPGDPPRPIEAPPATEVVVRPLGSHAWTGGERSWTRVLWPLVDFSRDGAERRSWVLPFWYRQVRAEPGGGRNGRWMLFPFLFAGRSEAEGGYFAVFPVAGRLRGLLGQDRIDFLLFPLLWHNLWDGTHSLHLFFPFYNRMWDGGRSGWRIWPFYGSYRAWADDGRERYRRKFILWPFWFRQENELNSRRPEKFVFFLPFFGQSETPTTLTRTYLWPIFHTSLDKTTGRKSWFGYIIPYRFDEDHFDLWPIFGLKTIREATPLDPRAKVEARRRHFILFPIERYDRWEDDQRRSVRFWLLPFYWRFHEVRKTDGEESLEWKLWPLARYTQVAGRTDLHLPSPLWFRQELPFERLYARLWRLYSFHEDSKGRGWEALFAFLSFRERKEEGVRTFRVLGGLYELRRAPGGVSQRFFYLPWRGNE